MRYICPLITVENIERSRKFYQEVMEQTVKYDFGENVTFHGDFAIHLKSHYQTLLGNEHLITKGGNDFELYFEQDDMDLLLMRLTENGVRLVHPLREQPWRQRVIRFYDPDNNVIEVGESLEHLAFRLYGEGGAIPEIASIIGLPEAFVEASVQQFSDKRL